MARMCRDLVFSAVIITVSVLSTVVCQEPCHYGMSVNITGATKLATGHYVHNDIMYTANQTFEYSDENNSPHRRGCVCLVKNCLRKCCPIGQLYLGNECVVSNDSLVNPFNPPVHNKTYLLEDLHAHKHFGLVFGNPCPGESYMLNPYTEPSTKDEDAFFIQANGDLYMPWFETNINGQKECCIEAFAKNPQKDIDPEWTTKYLALTCYEDDYDDDGDDDYADFNPLDLKTIGIIISIPFWLVTFLVYALIPGLQNLHGKALMLYVFCISVTLITIVIRAFYDPQRRWFTLDGTIYFFHLSSMFWLNVLCFDIWWTFSGHRSHESNSHPADRRRFLYCCLYAGGFPLLLTSVRVIRNIYLNFTNSEVLFYGSEEWILQLFTYILMIILVSVNCILFGNTAWKIIKENIEIAILRTVGTNNSNNDKRSFFVFVKLFFTMGISWVSEILGIILDTTSWRTWLVIDLANVLQGVFIFTIFVWNQNVKKLIKKRYRILRYGKSESSQNVQLQILNT